MQKWVVLQQRAQLQALNKTLKLFCALLSIVCKYEKRTLNVAYLLYINFNVGQS